MRVDIFTQCVKREEGLMVLRSGLCCYTEGWGGKCSEILAMIKLL